MSTKPHSILGEHEGFEILGTSLRIRGAGDGLSNAMKVAPRVLRHGEEVNIVIHGKVEDIIFDPQHSKDDEGGILGVTRVHVIKAQAAVLTDNADVAAALLEQHEAITRMRDAERGQQTLSEAEGGE